MYKNWIAQKFTGLFAWMYGVKAEDVQKHFDEDQARRRRHLRQRQAVRRSNRLDRRGSKGGGRRERPPARCGARQVFKDLPDQASSERAKTKAEAEAEEGLAKASKELAAAAKAACEESTKKTHPTLKKASDVQTAR